jgi:signal transduction histidine kinase
LRKFEKEWKMRSGRGSNLCVNFRCSNFFTVKPSMPLSSHHRRQLRAGGYSVLAAAWLCNTIGSVTYPDAPFHVDVLANVAFLGFGLAFWFTSDADNGSKHINGALLALQSLLILLSVSLEASYSTCLLGIVVLWQVTLAYGWGTAAAWCAVQTAVLLLSYTTHLALPEALRLAAVALGFQAFSIGMALVARAEAHGRVRMAKANEELHALQSRLAASSLLAERGRIARDLHDAVGHGLAALSLQLEVASHVASGQGLQHVLQAKSITESLLEDIREVIGIMRTEQIAHLGTALDKLAGKVDGTGIAITLAPDVRQDDAALNLVVFRIVQEAITNTLRHARARKMQISINNDDGMVVVEAKDDGCGRADMKPGHGLCGMRERVEACGGNVFFWTAPDAGFRVRAILPYGAA